jgi:hypothetical protein
MGAHACVDLGDVATGAGYGEVTPTDDCTGEPSDTETDVGELVEDLCSVSCAEQFLGFCRDVTDRSPHRQRSETRAVLALHDRNSDGRARRGTPHQAHHGHDSGIDSVQQVWGV